MTYRHPDRLTTRAQFRLTPQEKAQAEEQARVAGMTLSTYCRHRVLSHRIIADTDQNMIRELRRVGGLLKHVHTESKGAYSAQTADALAQIKACIEHIAKP